MTKIGDEVQNLLDELVAEYNQFEPLQPDEVTVERLAKRLGISNRQAEYMLERKTQSGELIRIKKRNTESGNILHVYMKP